MFLWTRRLQFWETCQKLKASSPIMFCSTSKNGKKSVFQTSKVCHQKNPMDTLSYFDKLDENFLARSLKFFFLNAQIWKKQIFFLQKIWFSSDCSSAHVECSFDNAVDTLLKRKKKTCSVSQKGEKNSSFHEKVVFLQKFFSWTARTQIW